MIGFWKASFMRTFFVWMRWSDILNNYYNILKWLIWKELNMHLDSLRREQQRIRICIGSKVYNSFSLWVSNQLRLNMFSFLWWGITITFIFILEHTMTSSRNILMFSLMTKSLRYVIIKNTLISIFLKLSGSKKSSFFFLIFSQVLFQVLFLLYLFFNYRSDEFWCTYRCMWLLVSSLWAITISHFKHTRF